MGSEYKKRGGEKSQVGSRWGGSAKNKGKSIDIQGVATKGEPGIVKKQIGRELRREWCEKEKWYRTYLPSEQFKSAGTRGGGVLPRF